MRPAMFTIEVLISIFILFLVVTLSATSSKFLNQMLKQQERYKGVYFIIFSIKDKISKDICSKQERIEGRFDGIEYIAQCRLEKEQRGFVKDYDFDEGKDISGYTSSIRFKLYKVELSLVNYNYTSSYYVTKYELAIPL